MKIDYRMLMEEGERVARRAGAMIRSKIGHVAVHEKGPADLVTEADIASQELVREMLAGMHPDHRLIGEEDAATPGTPAAWITSGNTAEAAAAKSGFVWIVDPIDGTTNYAHGVPLYCVSLALAHDGDLVVGIVYDPNQDECFTAARGAGAFLNGHPIRSSRVVDLEDALCALSFPAHVQRSDSDVLCFMELIGRTQSIRRTGSAALNLAYVAAGRFDAASAYRTKIWDFAAGTVLVREAGGVITTWSGEPITLCHTPHIAAATPELAETLLVCTRRFP